MDVDKDENRQTWREIHEYQYLSDELFLNNYKIILEDISGPADGNYHFD